MQLFLLHSSHLIVICVTPACCSRLSLLINLSLCFLSLPSPAPLCCCPSPLVLLFLCPLLSCSFSPPVTLCLHPHTPPPFSLKSTKSRGSKHKPRRKPKKQKRPSSVCNPVTWSQNGSRPSWLIIVFFFLNIYLKCACACWLTRKALWLCVISVNCVALASCISF